MEGILPGQGEYVIMRVKFRNAAPFKSKHDIVLDQQNQSNYFRVKDNTKTLTQSLSVQISFQILFKQLLT